MTAVRGGTLVVLSLLAAACQNAVMTRTPEPRLVIVDTDAGSDDFMALALLVSSPAVHIEAITVGPGLAHADAGARNMLRFLRHVGRDDIPVYIGRAAPLDGGRAFPDAWRDQSDTLPGVDLPEPARSPEREGAIDFLARRLMQTERPVTVLALGALTNIAEAFRANDGAHPALQDLVIMGGAVNVPGNLGDVGERENTTAEWNFYIDAEAARRVFESGAPILLVPLDATNSVPVDRSYVDALQDATSPAAATVVQLLEMAGDFVDAGHYYAWDPLAAVAIVEPDVVATRAAHIRIVVEPPDVGRSVEMTSSPANAQVALDADAERFRRIFVDALRRPRQ